MSRCLFMVAYLAHVTPIFVQFEAQIAACHAFFGAPGGWLL